MIDKPTNTGGRRLTLIPLAEVPEDHHPDAIAIGDVETAITILRRWPGDDDERGRALRRLFDATIRIAERMGVDQVTSGLGDARGWTMRRGKRARRRR